MSKNAERTAITTLGVPVLAAAMAAAVGPAVSCTVSGSGHAPDGARATVYEAGATSAGDGPVISIAPDASPSGRPVSVRIAVPAYFYPDQQWQRLIAAAPKVGMIIFNPNSGPGAGSDGGLGDPNYQAVIAQAKAAGIIVLGYVSTNYGQRAPTDVLADINAYYDLYSPSGIYLAEGPMDADCTSMQQQYQGFANAAHARDSRAFLAVGTRFCPTYIYFFDLMVQFARTWSEYQTYQPPSWMPANSPERFCHFVDSVSAADASAALTLTVTNGAGWVYVTDQTDPNPWGMLPSYFDQELAALTH
jgi:hypothetical protein